MGCCGRSTVNPEVLHLTLKHRWFDMIASGEKTEEYRVPSPRNIALLRDKSQTCVDKGLYGGQCELWCWELQRCGFAPFREVCFHRGYSNVTMTFAVAGISYGRGKVEWGAPADEDVFIIKLGNRL